VSDRLGPIREEARAVLFIARNVCEAHDQEAWGENSQWKTMIAIGAISKTSTDLINSAKSFEEWVSSDESWISDWVRNVSRFCADVLRWTHEAERMREVTALYQVLSQVLVIIDSETKTPLRHMWQAIAIELGNELGYDVTVGVGITLRHGRLSFDREESTFVFSWG